MEKLTESKINNFEGRHYFRKAKAPTHWFDLSEGKLKEYIEKYGDDFRVIIYDGNNLDSDYYIIPYSVLKNILVEANKDTNRPRWIGSITNDKFKIKKESLDVEKYHNIDLKNVLFDEFEYLFENIIKFIKQAQTSDLKYKNYLKNYAGLKVRVSFGQTNPANIPWMCFLKERETIQNGYYPGIYYDKKYSNMFTILGISETNKPNRSWPRGFISNLSTFEQSPEPNSVMEKFPNSYIYNMYHINRNDIENSLNEVKGSVRQDLDQIFRVYVSGYKNTSLSKDSKSNLLHQKKQIILYGPPGTGKTYHTKRKSVEIITNGDFSMNVLEQVNIDQQYRELKEDGQIEFITFHPSYSYEEFVEGITIDIDSRGKPTKDLKYKLKQGIFKQMVVKALSKAIDEDNTNYSLGELIEKYRYEMISVVSNYETESEKKEAIKDWWSEKPRFVLIIDEINRGDISKIFGELITLMEADKRLGMENELTVKLPYSQEDFGIPPNLYIIATMNTADKSIALIDVALRRRFGFMEMNPDFDLLKKEHLIKNTDALKKEDVYDGLEASIDKLDAINKRIAKDPSVGRDKQIGHSFLFKVKNQNDLIMVWKNEILPLLEEYYYGNYSKINELLFKKATSSWLNEENGIKGLDKYANLISFLDEVSSNE